MQRPIENPLEINERHGDESAVARQARKNVWLAVAAVIIAFAAAAALLARTGVGPGPQTVPLASQPTAVQSTAVPPGLPSVKPPPLTPSNGAQPANLAQNGAANP